MDEAERLLDEYRDSLQPRTPDIRTDVARRDKARAAVLTAMRKAGGVPEWQTIDSAPKDGRYVDVWSIDPEYGFGFRTANAFWKDGDWHQRHWGKLMGSTITHWMEPPTGPGAAAPKPPALDRDGIIEACAQKADPIGPRPCDCERCDCGNVDDAERVARWDTDSATAAAIRAMKAS
jgi:hypothetical protein